MVEEHIQNDPGISPPGQFETRQRLVDQRMAVGKHVDPTMQLNGCLDRRRELPFHAALDEIAIEAAEQLFRVPTTQVEMREIVHGLSLASSTPISL